MRGAELLAAAFSGLSCKFKGCDAGVVGASIAKTGGHVCKRHNVQEWADALERNRDPYYRHLAASLRAELAGGTSEAAEPLTPDSAPTTDETEFRCID